MLEILLNNLLEFPARVWNNFVSYVVSFYDTNEGFLENLFYNDWLWIFIGLLLYVKCGGKGCLYLIFFLIITWLISKMIIAAFGIEVFFIMLLISVGIAYLVKK